MNEVQLLQHVAELCATSATATDLCRSLVHSPISGADAVGASVHLTTLAGDLELIGSYGKIPDLGEDHSIWGDNPLARAVRGQIGVADKMSANPGGEFFVGATPVLKGNNPIGVISMLRTRQESLIAYHLSEAAIRSLANTFGIWVDSLGIRPATGPVDIQVSGELTDRQLEILRHMAGGKTNAQIAAELILSESSIRQETVRIYRALGVGTRAEAARKGLNLGLIEKVAI